MMIMLMEHLQAEAASQTCQPSQHTATAFLWDVKKNGLPPYFDKLRIYTSEISHFSMEKSAHLLGLGYKSVVKLPVDAKCSIDINKAEEIIKSDVEKLQQSEQLILEA